MRLIDEHALVIAGKGTVIDGELYIKVDDLNKCLDEAEVIQPQRNDRLIEEMEKIKFTAFLTLANSGNESLDKAWEYSSTYLDEAIEAVKRSIQPTSDGWILCSSKGRKGLLGRIAEYFKEWDGQEPAPTMQMSIDDLRTIAAMNVERCALQEEVRKLRLPQPYKESGSCNNCNDHKESE